MCSSQSKNAEILVLRHEVRCYAVCGVQKGTVALRRRASSPAPQRQRRPSSTPENRDNQTADGAAARICASTWTSFGVPIA